MWIFHQSRETKYSLNGLIQKDGSAVHLCGQFPSSWLTLDEASFDQSIPLTWVSGGPSRVGCRKKEAVRDKDESEEINISAVIIS
jgi:hypothetical protein